MKKEEMGCGHGFECDEMHKKDGHRKIEQGLTQSDPNVIIITKPESEMAKYKMNKKKKMMDEDMD